MIRHSEMRKEGRKGEEGRKKRKGKGLGWKKVKRWHKQVIGAVWKRWEWMRWERDFAFFERYSFFLSYVRMYRIENTESTRNIHELGSGMIEVFGICLNVVTYASDEGVF